METLLRFRILAPLYDLNRATITLPTTKGNVKFRFKITLSGQSMWITSGNVRVVGDDIGAMHNTIVEVEFPTAVDIGMPAQPGGFNEAQQVSVQLLNVVLGHYRRVARLPQIRPIAIKHAGGYEYVLRAEDGKGQVGTAGGGIGLKPDGEDAGLADGSAEIIARVQEGAWRGALPVWYSLYQDALAEIGSDNYRSALAHLYISFEMLATTACRVLGTAKIGEAAIEAFLDPEGEDEHHPSIYRVVKQTRDWYGEGPSKTQLEEQVGRLWKHRNDVMHGAHIDISREDINQAVEVFSVLGPWYNQMLDSVAATVELSDEERPPSGA